MCWFFFVKNWDFRSLLSGERREREREEKEGISVHLNDNLRDNYLEIYWELLSGIYTRLLAKTSRRSFPRDFIISRHNAIFANFVVPLIALSVSRVDGVEIVRVVNTQIRVRDVRVSPGG